MGCGASSKKRKGAAFEVHHEVKFVSSPVAKGEPQAAAPKRAASTEAAETTEQVVARIDGLLGTRPRICILGGLEFRDKDSKALVEHIARDLSKAIGTRAVVVTGGMSGVQATFAKHCHAGSVVWNLLPSGQASGFGVGQDLAAGRTLDQRKDVYGEIGDIYLTVEGGPGVSGEARAAVRRGAAVVPMMRTGGASEGQFEFPASALQREPSCAASEWELIRSKDAAVAESAKAAVAILLRHVERVEKCRRDSGVQDVREAGTKA